MEYDEVFFEAVLRNHYEDPSIEVISVEDEPAATGKGEHFLSDMLRIRVKFTRSSSSCCENETRSFFLKHEPIGDSRVLEMVRDQQMFTVELRVLRDIVPKIEAALGVRLGPKFIHGTDEPPRAILMEDLTPEGFCIKNRQHGLSIEHATMAIKNLARFHAGSVALSEEVCPMPSRWSLSVTFSDQERRKRFVFNLFQNPEALRSFKQGIFNASTHPNMFVLAVNSLNRLSEDATTWSDVEIALAAKKLGEIVAFVEDRVRNVYEYDEEEFCVLNHGDAWVNNILYTEDESGKPLEQVFVRRS